MKKLFTLLLTLGLLLGFSGCAQSNPEPELTNPEISEKAMENFVKKLEAGNYLVKNSKFATIAVSPELAYIEYPHEGLPTVYAFMSVKGETFQAMIDEEEIDRVYFVSNGTALEALGEMIPNSWITLTENNLWEIFYNDPEKPLEFTSNDVSVKTTMVALGGYSEFALPRMGEVRMTLDAMNPTKAHFSAEVSDDPVARIEYANLDLTIEFGAGKIEPRIEKWLKNPVYPPTRTAWTKEDLGTMELIFHRDYGNEAMPFPAASSYAMIFDDSHYMSEGTIILTDSHSSEKDVEDYKQLLRDKGFEEAEGKRMDGSAATVFRKVLREDYKAYSQLYVAFDKGLYVEGSVYYDEPELEGIAAISELVQQHGFAPLSETDVFGEWITRNIAASKSESWAYFFDYNLYSQIKLQYQDFEKAKAYLSNYADKMLNMGFKKAYTPGENNRMVASSNDMVSFEYHFSEEEDNTVTLLFKNQKTLNPMEVDLLLRAHGLPDIDVFGIISAKDTARYYHEISGFEGLHLFIYQPYSTEEKAEEYLDSLVERLVDMDYLPIDPQRLGCSRTYLFFNEELRKYVAFDLGSDSQGKPMILYEIVSIETPLDEDDLKIGSILHR